MRNLASIQTIVDLQPIPNKDKIEYATVLGWHVIVKKDEFKIGDKCVYFEIDVKCPETEVFEFLRPRGFKVKTLKMAGVVSQGLALPWQSFSQFKGKEPALGTDVSALLNIVKYDPEAEKESLLLAEKQAKEKNKIKKFLMKNKWYRRFFSGKKESKGFPSWIHKTDETRIQTMPYLFKDKPNLKLIVTEKIDGTSTTWFLINKKGFFQKPLFGVCSRNIYLKNRDGSIYWEMAIKHNVETVLKQIAKDYNAKTIVLQGESIGPGICGDKYQIGKKFYAFNLIIDGVAFSTLNIKNVLSPYGIETVPILDMEFTLPETCDLMMEYSNAKSVINPKIDREGVVCRNVEENISFKAVSPNWLLKYKE